MNIELHPLEGIVIDNKTILFGASVEEVKAKLGRPETEYRDKPYSAPVALYYFESDLRFDFRDDKLEFIEFLGGYVSDVQPVIYGVKAFRTKADEFLKLLIDKNNGDIDDSDEGYGYDFLNSCVGISREFIPEDLEDPDDYDMLQAEYWCTIGIGCEGYYDFTKEL